MPNIHVTRHIVNGKKAKKRSSSRRRKNKSRRTNASRRARHTFKSTSSHNRNRGESPVKKEKSKRRRSRKHRSNPVARVSRRRGSTRADSRSRRHRSNPSRMGGLNTMNAKSVATVAVGAGAGFVLTRTVTQAVLQGKNAGATGYLGNALTVGALAWAGHKFGGKVLGFSVLAGGLAAIVARLWEDNVSNVSLPKLSGVRGLSDLMYASGRVGGLGFVDSFFALPSISQPIPGSPYAAVAAPFPQPVAAAPANLKAMPNSRRFANAGRGR